MTRNHAPRSPFFPPDIRVSPLHNASCTRRVPHRLDGLSTHHNGDITAKPDRLNPPLKSSVPNQASLDQRQSIAPARRYPILGIIHDKFFRPQALKRCHILIVNGLTLLLFELAYRVFLAGQASFAHNAILPEYPDSEP
jgi:hypothetical protein